jgi:arabinan endo-1,5-alpha-L-arabinosidase
MHDGGRDLIVYHAYDAQNNARPTLRISEVTWSADGWPRANL